MTVRLLLLRAYGWLYGVLYPLAWLGRALRWLRGRLG